MPEHKGRSFKITNFFCLENLTYRCCKFWYYLDISQVDYTQIIWPYTHTNPEITKVFFPFLLYLICSSSSSSPKAQIPLCFQYGNKDLENGPFLRSYRKFVLTLTENISVVKCGKIVTKFEWYLSVAPNLTGLLSS